jgi:hypothetical protein
MNKLIMFMVLITLQLWGFAWGSSYLIYLKNGNQLRTSYYWEEGDEIRFYVYGGIVGIPKHSIIGFKKSTKIEDDPMVRDQKVTDRTDTQSSNRQTTSRRGDKKDEPVDINYYREKKAALKGKLEGALEKNREATRSKDPQAKEATRQEMLKHATQLHALEDELKEKNQGTLPDWWKE